MHAIQKSILQALENNGVLAFQLREIGRLLGVEHPQSIKHHLGQLEKKGLIVIDAKQKTIRKKTQMELGRTFISVPILGGANCGAATLFANDNVEGMLKISRSLLKTNKDNIFVLRASGDSMNQANVNGRSIENGDYVLVEADNSPPQNNEYVVSLIDGCANIKKFIWDTDNNQAVLISESLEEYPPIFIDQDVDYGIAGRVVQVLKKPKI